jgi:oxygen-independent coproporphyrinogen-3 oxidase
VSPAATGSPSRDVVASIEQPPAALYVHVPFCVSLCPYCDFVVYAGAAARGPRNRISAFVTALESELRLRADALDARWPDGRPPLETLYFGGGTPSLLSPSAVGELIALVRDRFGLAVDAEVTLEANPGPDERGNARGFATAGVTRISIGAQSLDAAELRRLGRRHRPEDVAEAVAAARDAGLRSVSVDLLYDIPGSTIDTWEATLETVLKLEPDHLSLYALTLDDPDSEGLTGLMGDHLPTTSGARRWRERARSEQDDDNAAGQYVHAVERLAGDGWRGYEISNWARSGHESGHNLVYWKRRPYEAVGPGAHAFDGRTRRWNAARLAAYVNALAPATGSPPSRPPGGSEVIDEATARAEALILALRTDEGVAVASAWDADTDGAFNWAAAEGLTTVSRDDRIVLTTRGRLLSNELFARLV